MTTRIQRASVRNGQPFNYQEDTEEEYDDEWPPRLPTSAIRYDRSISRAPAVVVSGNRRYILHEGVPPPQTTQQAVAPRERRRVHWSLIFGIGMCAMVVLWILGNLLINWWGTMQDDIHYGRPRTFQIDAVVGHNDSPSHPTHFIVSNVNRHIIIFELPGGDASKAKIYLGPSLFGDNTDLNPVTLTFRDVNGDGKLDMIINTSNAHIIFINDRGQFRPLKAGEQVSS